MRFVVLNSSSYFSPKFYFFLHHKNLVGFFSPETKSPLHVPTKFALSVENIECTPSLFSVCLALSCSAVAVWLLLLLLLLFVMGTRVNFFRFEQSVGRSQHLLNNERFKMETDLTVA